MTSRNRRDELEGWVARRLHRAADGLSLAISYLDELSYEAHRPRTTLTPEVRDAFDALLRDAVALRDRVRASSPLPIDDED